MKNMNEISKYLSRCLDLARNGEGFVAPNPMVGAVIVYDDKIIGEGYHRRYGEAHAEPNAINAVEDKNLLKNATLYVNLEPCSHYGKTPPCADLIIARGIPRVVVGTLDPNPKVAGRGIEKLRQAGIDVQCGILEVECRQLNKHFFTFQEKKRPFITLKWAQTNDEFIDTLRENSEIPPLPISNEMTKIIAHKTRAEHQAILVGTNTAVLDSPRLNVRHWSGRNPIRIAIDRNGRISENSYLFDGSVQTIIFTEKSLESRENLEFVRADFDGDFLKNLIQNIYERNINSVLVEGGAQLLNSFIEQNLWDEARVEISPEEIKNGISAPIIPKIAAEEKVFQGHRILFFENCRN